LKLTSSEDIEELLEPEFSSTSQGFASKVGIKYEILSLPQNERRRTAS
jgi:hypothetical protein